MRTCEMPRYLVERHFPDGVAGAVAEDGMAEIADANRFAEVAWLCSYVTDDSKTMFCLYEADSPEALRRAARRAGLPLSVIHRVSVLDPHGFKVPRRALDDAAKPVGLGADR